MSQHYTVTPNQRAGTLLAAHKMIKMKPCYINYYLLVIVAFLCTVLPLQVWNIHTGVTNSSQTKKSWKPVE